MTINIIPFQRSIEYEGDGLAIQHSNLKFSMAVYLYKVSQRDIKKTPEK